MESNKGKPVTTSVPSITIKFHANAEQLEELYTMSDEEADISATTLTTTTTTTNEPDKSPLKLFPRLVKRSTSIDITPVKQSVDNSPPSSDPWRFFSDIKGKITKSVEDKLIEIKSRNHDDGGGSPSKLKDSSSLSDSEEISESSLSKTCGVVSTTEGVEMSTDDDDDDEINDADPEDDGDEKKLVKKPKNLRQRFKLLRSSTLKKQQHNNNNNNSITINNLTKLYNINTDRVEQALPECSDTNDDIENAIEAIEDEYDKRIITTINSNYENISIDGNTIRLNEVHGNDLKNSDKTTVFAPIGFVDMRDSSSESIIINRKRLNYHIMIILIILVLYLLLYYYSAYWSGVLFGIITMHLYQTIKWLLYPNLNENLPQSVQQQQLPERVQNIIEIEAVEEWQPLKKHEGWVNELPEKYDPHTYHINKTQSVYLRLQGNLLRISHTRMKISKRALWNETKLTKPVFTHHRIYNLLNAKVVLLPKGLAKKRYWSKKYPICIVLTTATEQIQLDQESVAAGGGGGGGATTSQQQQQQEVDSVVDDGGVKIKKKLSISQQFSKLAADEEHESELQSRASTPSSDLTEQSKKYDFDIDDEDVSVTSEAWTLFDDCHHNQTKLYIFGRTDRDKEEWFRRLQLATVPQQQQQQSNNTDDSNDTTSSNLETNYLKYMQYFNRNLQLNRDDFEKIREDLIKDTTTSTTNRLLEEYCLNNILWINTLIGRVLFDCLYNNVNFTQKIKERIQRKLTTIKLPYFIEEISITELALGQTPPIIHKAKKPVINERGLWIDLDITYEGLIVLILHTKLNLMKLRQPPERTSIDEKPAIFNSDLDDSAESSSDDNLVQIPTEQQLFDQQQTNLTNPSGSRSSKKLIRMVDKIAESKFFQAAAENRLIKKAMENVSNTDLGLRCELKHLIGTLVLNIPTPPSDRLWIGFQPRPTILMKAQPIVGETNITFMRITGWIERKLLQEFEKVLVIPNMEDLVIPVMTPKTVD